VGSSPNDIPSGAKRAAQPRSDLLVEASQALAGGEVLSVAKQADERIGKAQRGHSPGQYGPVTILSCARLRMPVVDAWLLQHVQRLGVSIRRCVPFDDALLAAALESRPLFRPYAKPNNALAQ
jgi:hypothetical protein